MPDLYVDAGNTMIKAAVHDRGGWREIFRRNVRDRESFFAWLDRYRGTEADTPATSRIIVSSVVKEISEELTRRYSEESLVLIRPGDLPSERVDYRQSSTLGVDRFLTCLAASEESSGPVVVIDAGTACTVDNMTGDGIYRGGVIMPGLKMMKRSMTRELPELPAPGDGIPDRWPGQSTLESVRWGTTGAFLEAIGGFLERYRREYGSYDLFVTGGDSALVYRHLSRSPDVKERPWLMYQGMAQFSRRYLKITRNG